MLNKFDQLITDLVTRYPALHWHIYIMYWYRIPEVNTLSPTGVTDPDILALHNTRRSKCLGGFREHRMSSVMALTLHSMETLPLQ